MNSDLDKRIKLFKKHYNVAGDQIVAIWNTAGAIYRRPFMQPMLTHLTFAVKPEVWDTFIARGAEVTTHPVLRGKWLKVFGNFYLTKATPHTFTEIEWYEAAHIYTITAVKLVKQLDETITSGYTSKKLLDYAKLLMQGLKNAPVEL